MNKDSTLEKKETRNGVIEAGDFGFLPDASGIANAAALQRAVDCGGTITVSRPGTYRIARTVYIGSHTALRFAPGVVVRKVAEHGPFTHVLLNKGALTRTYDEQITVEGLQIAVNGVDVRDFEIYGLHGHLAFFYVRDLRIQRFRCFDMAKAQYAIHVCTFEDIIIDDVIIKGRKDGVHLGRGKRFTIRNGVFQTFDDAVALNAHDWAVGNPELGWIEDGVVEKCWDLAADETTGFFCRLLAGGWRDWEAGMKVQQGDTVVSEGRLYRVQAQPDETSYTSNTPPDHAEGQRVIDGIPWGMVQTDVTYTAGVRNVAFRDIFLQKNRVGFAYIFCNNRFSRSYYPGASVPMQEKFTFDNVRVQHDYQTPFAIIKTPVDAITITNSTFRNSPVRVGGDPEVKDHGKTSISLVGCTFAATGNSTLLTNAVAEKKIKVKTSGSLVLNDEYFASVNAGDGQVITDSDLPGLQPVPYQSPDKPELQVRNS
ncbi:MAG: hypothetical protein ACOCUY_03335 [Verrucomicrobiota bacterium]